VGYSFAKVGEPQLAMGQELGGLDTMPEFIQGDGQVREREGRGDRGDRGDRGMSKGEGV